MKGEECWFQFRAYKIEAGRLEKSDLNSRKGNPEQCYMNHTEVTSLVVGSRVWLIFQVFYIHFICIQIFRCIIFLSFDKFIYYRGSTMMEMLQICDIPSFFKQICKNAPPESTQKASKGIFCSFSILKNSMSYCCVNGLGAGCSRRIGGVENHKQ